MRKPTSDSLQSRLREEKNQKENRKDCRREREREEETQRAHRIRGYAVRHKINLDQASLNDLYLGLGWTSGQSPLEVGHGSARGSLRGTKECARFKLWH